MADSKAALGETLSLYSPEWAPIIASKTQDQILTGRISGIEKIKINDQVMECAIVFYGDIKVYIPFEWMGIPREDWTIVRSMMGAEIDFVIRHIDAARKITLASREYAMKLRRELELSKHKVGDKILVRIDAVGKNEVIAEVYGIETRIPKNEVEYGYVGNLNDYVQVGDKVPAVIKELDIEKGIVKVSIKEAKPDPREKIGIKYVKGGEYLGVVRGRKIFPKKDDIVELIFVELEKGITAACITPPWKAEKLQDLKPGDAVNVKIVGISRSKNIYGHIIRKQRRGAV